VRSGEVRDCLIPHFQKLTVFASTPLDRTGAAPRNHTWVVSGPVVGMGRPAFSGRNATLGCSSRAASGRASVASSGGASTAACAARCSCTQRRCSLGTCPPRRTQHERTRIAPARSTCRHAPRRGAVPSARPRAWAGDAATTNARPAPHAIPDRARRSPDDLASGRETPGSAGRSRNCGPSTSQGRSNPQPPQRSRQPLGCGR
jgi:hypothetical protein